MRRVIGGTKMLRVIIIALAGSSLFLFGQALALDAKKLKADQIHISYQDPKNPEHREIAALMKERQVLEKIRDILDPQTRTVGVRIEMPNRANRLRLEMFATVELPTLGTHAAFTVPTEAVQTINRRPVVFIKQDALHFAARRNPARLL